MKRFLQDQKGLAAVEMAIGLTLLVPLFLVLVEATRALTEYAQLQNAAMEGGRMVMLQQGDTSGVEDFIKNSVLTDANGNSLLNGAEPTVTISNRDANNNVTVQVDHDYSPLFATQHDGSGNSNSFNLLGDNTLTISAKNVVALPAAN